jgi:hypothetical protein
VADLMLEPRIAEAVADGIIVDKRGAMPKGHGSWPKVPIEFRLGACVHQNASPNSTNPVRTAEYHVGPNHISPRGLPGIVYHVAIPDLGSPAWLCSDLLDRTYGQAADDDTHPGDENTHLISILMMGGFSGPGYHGHTGAGPTKRQLEAFAIALDWLEDVFGFDQSGLFGHYHFGKVACPGYVLTNWIEGYRRQARRNMLSDHDWQLALLRWHPNCLPRYGADGVWGGESKSALAAFQRDQRLRVTAMQDPFTELMMMKRYPAPKSDEESITDT